MREPALSRLLAAAAALALRPPDATTLDALAESGGGALDPDQARQDFYDALCVPQSGRYIPPYAHVLARGAVRQGGQWRFPPPRFDGGDALAPWYAAIGFDPMRLDADPMLRGAHRPLDQIGFLLAYLAALAAASEAGAVDGGAAGSFVSAFLAENFSAWPDRFRELLGGAGSAYLRAVAEAIEEALLAARERYPVAVATPSTVEMPRVAS